MIIRKFQPADLEEILVLFHEVVHAVGAKYYNDLQVDAWAPENGQDKDKWLQTLNANITYVVEDKGKIIGFGDMTQTGYIDHLYVHKNYQGTGAALKIFRKLEEEARRLGLTELKTEASVMAMPIAQRHGFEIVEKRRKVLRGAEFETYAMRKQLY